MTSAMTTTPAVRPARAEDLPAIKAIYDHEVRHGISTFDLVPPPLAYWETRLASTARGDHLLVADVAGEVVGYAYSSPYRPRPAYDLTRETSVYCADGTRGQGLGRALYDALLPLLAVDEIHRAVALVALPNPASEALHRSTGFRHIGTMTEVGFKFDRWIDTAWWELALTR